MIARSISQKAFSFRPQHYLTCLGVVLAAAGCKEPAANTPNAPGSNSGSTASSANAAPPYDANQAKIVLGEYGSLTGATATFGKSSDNGIQMATDEINKAGGILGKQVEIKVVDDASKTEQASSAVLKLINEDKVLAVLGEVASSRSLAAAPVCQKAGVPMLSPSSTNPAVTEVGDYIFRTCFIDPFQGTVMSKFARDTLKAKKAAVLTDVANDYSKGLTQFFIEDWKKNGGTIVADPKYSEGDKDFHGQLTAIKGKNPDVIYIPGYYTEVGNIAVQARSSGLKQPMLGGDGWDSPKLFEIGRNAIEGSYFSNHYSPESKDPKVVKFVGDYKARFGETPDSLAACAYDAARIMFEAIKRAGELDRAKLRDALAQTKDFDGVTGTISINDKRNAVKPAAILQVKGNGAEFVKTVEP